MTDTDNMKPIDGGWIDAEGNFFSEDDAILDDMTVAMDNEDVHCFQCKHYQDEEKCAAFPEGIPDDIFLGIERHDKQIRGDSGIQFEKSVVIPRTES